MKKQKVNHKNSRAKARLFLFGQSSYPHNLIAKKNDMRNHTAPTKTSITRQNIGTKAASTNAPIDSKSGTITTEKVKNFKTNPLSWASFFMTFHLQWT